MFAVLRLSRLAAASIVTQRRAEIPKRVRYLARLVTSPRMGSFSSAPKIPNDDVLDEDVSAIPSRITRQELLHLCHARHSDHPMVKRAFRRPGSAQPHSDLAYGLKARKLNALSEACGDYISTPETIRIFQWNMLSQSLGQFNDHFVRCPDEALEWDHRRFHLIEEIIEYNPDVICLQEVDHFNFLKHLLGTQGYAGVFYPKPDSPCIYINGNNGPDGCAVFYRKDKFDLVRRECKILEVWRVQSNQVAILAILRLRETGEEVCLVTTHLKARKGALLATLRNEQGKDLLSFLGKHCGGRPVVMCGDFNAEPTEPVYSTILKSEFQLSSAYADPLEPEYTTWKIRDEGEIRHTIDYVFYTNDTLEVDAVLDFPTGDEIGTDRIPSFSYPSDHFSLVADFKLKKP